MESMIAIFPLTSTSRILIRKVGQYCEYCLEDGDLFMIISHWRMLEILEQYKWNLIPSPEDRKGSHCSGEITCE